MHVRKDYNVFNVDNLVNEHRHYYDGDKLVQLNLDSHSIVVDVQHLDIIHRQILFRVGGAG